jgi:hypothetical protein
MQGGAGMRTVVAMLASAALAVASFSLVGGDPDPDRITFAGWENVDYGTVTFNTPDEWESEAIEIPALSLVAGDFEISRGDLWGHPEVVVFVIVNDEVIVEYGPFAPPYLCDEDINFFYDGTDDPRISLKFRVVRSETCCKAKELELAAEYRYTAPTE